MDSGLNYGLIIMKIHQSYRRYVNSIKERNLSMMAYSNLVGKDFSFSPDEISMDATEKACGDLLHNQILKQYPRCGLDG